jgi:hypothetical protein
MKRLTYRTENQWRWLRDGSSVDLLRLSFEANAYQAGVALTVVGFGVGLTFWRSLTLECVGSLRDAMKSYAWEPIESNGWAGEPQGREHAP